jgi:hypothetical protein
MNVGEYCCAKPRNVFPIIPMPSQDFPGMRRTISEQDSRVPGTDGAIDTLVLEYRSTCRCTAIYSGVLY